MNDTRKAGTAQPVRNRPSHDLNRRRFVICGLLSIGALLIGCLVWLQRNYDVLVNEFADQTMNTFGIEEINLLIDPQTLSRRDGEIRTCMRDVFCGEGVLIELSLNDQTEHTFELKEYIRCASNLPYRVGRNRISLTRVPTPDSQLACSNVRATGWLHMSTRYGSTRAYGVRLEEGESVSAIVNVVIREES